MNISISRDGTEIGEWTEEEVRAFYKEGRLVATDNYWREGMTAWDSLASFIKPPPPFPTTASVVIEPPPAPVLPPTLPTGSVVTAAAKIKKKRDWNKESMGCLGLVGSFIVISIGMTLSKTYLMPATTSALTPAVASDNDIDAQLANISNEINKGLPTTINEMLRQDSVSVAPNRTLLSHYSVLQAVDSAVLPQFQVRLRAMMLKSITDTPAIMKWRKKGVTYQYDYTGVDGTLLFSVVIKPDDTE